MGKLLKEKAPRFIASESDVDGIERILATAKPTPEFQTRIDEERRIAEVERLTAINEAADVTKLEKQHQLEEKERLIELQKMQEAEEVARGILKEAETVEGAKGLGYIVDDLRIKVDNIFRGYARIKHNLDYSLIFHWQKDPEVAIREIIALQRLSLEEPRIPVFVFMDGTLEKQNGSYTTGLATTQDLLTKSQEYETPMPYLVGNSGDSWRNDELKEIYQDLYITTHDRDMYPLGSDPEVWIQEPFDDIGKVIKAQLNR